MLVPSNKASEAIAAYFFSWKVMSTEEDAVLPLDRCQCIAETDLEDKMMLPLLQLLLCLGVILQWCGFTSVFTIDSGFKRQLTVPDIVEKQTKNCSDWLVRELRSSY